MEPSITGTVQNLSMTLELSFGKSLFELWTRTRRGGLATTAIWMACWLDGTMPKKQTLAA